MCDKERLNLYRLSRLLLEASTDTLRCFFEKHYSPQGDLQSFLKINRKKIKSLYKQNVITSDQKEILKPSNGTLPSLSNLDITLLCILLTNLCQVGKPQCGWTGEPDDKDLSTGADILRLRKTRNKLYAHRTNAMMTDSDFQETWGKTCKVISRLSSHLDQKQQEDIQSNIDEISKAQVDPDTMYKLFDILFSHALCKILDKIGDPPYIHSAPEDGYHEDAEEAETEIAKGYDGIIRVIKLYPELKSDMTRRSLTAIAKRLLDGKMISEDEYERLQDTTKPRRCLTDMLLKKILRVNPEKAELLKYFLSQLRIHHPAMATKISQMEVTEADRTAFREAKQYRVVGKNARVTPQNSHKLTDNEISFFERCLCESPDHVDSINDHLLSKFLISISDHSLINKSDKMISDLFKKVQLHSLEVESVLEHVLEKNTLEEWKKLRCEVPATVTLDQVMQDNSNVMKDDDIPNPRSTLNDAVLCKETAVGDAKDDEMTHFCRFFLLVMDPGKLTLQSFLEKQYSAKGDLQLFLKSKEREVNILCSKCIIKQWQVDILQPPTGDVPTVKNLDISTICILLIYLCKITKPPNGWKELPSNNDRSTGADILRLLHASENLVFYRKAGGMSAMEFNEKWDNIHGAISRLSVQLDDKEIDDIRSRMGLIREQSIDPGKERKINNEIFKRLLPQTGETQEMKLGEIITMDVDEVCSDQYNQGSSRTLLGWMRYAKNAVMNGFARQFQSDLNDVEKRSIVIKLLVWKDLKIELLDKDFVGKRLKTLIRKGCFETNIKLSGPVQVTVYILSPVAQGKKEEIHFHLELDSIKDDVKKPKVHLKSQDMKLLVEEMDPIELQRWIFDQLQIDINKQKIMNEIVSWQDLSRCDQMEILLDSIKRLENGFDMLAQYCKENDPYVYNKVFEKQEQLACTKESDTDKKAVWSSYRKGGGLQKLYSMQLDLDVEDKGMGDQNLDRYWSSAMMDQTEEQEYVYNKEDLVSPADLLKMDTRSLHMYNEALQNERNRVYNIRVMVVGNFGVGKTTLVKRLLGKEVDISVRCSTEGLNVHTECCRVSLSSAEWITQKNSSEQDYRLQHLARVIDAKQSQFNITDEEQVVIPPSVEITLESNERDHAAYSDRDALVSVSDFGGQIALFTTHQMFLTSRAIYLLVLDFSQFIYSHVDDECFLDTEGIMEYKRHDLVDVWMDTIHSCASSPKSNSPPVILVGTHVDKIPQHNRHEVCERCFKEIKIYLNDKPTRVHLIDEDFAIDNTVVDSRLEDLKRKIVEVASQQPYWGEEIPAYWLLLEQQLMKIRDTGVKVVPLSLVEDIHNSGSVRIKDRLELDLFLRFQNDMGTIIYFSSVEGLRETVVLDPQWLIDALNSLTTAEMFVLRNVPAIFHKWNEFKENGKLTQELIDAIWSKDRYPEFHDNKEHILLIMEHLNIIVRPRVYSEDGGEIMVENYFLAPYMLRQSTPSEIISPHPHPQTESPSVLCYVFLEKFLPTAIFHRLLAACVAHWPIARSKGWNQIFCGCCVLQLDLSHNLTLHFSKYVIYVRVTRMGISKKTPFSKLCIGVREFITTNLLKIIGYLGQSLKFEYFIQCPEYSGVSINSLIPVSSLKENVEVHCNCHDNIIESSKLLKFWFEDQQKLDPDEQISLDELHFIALERLRSGALPPEKKLISKMDEYSKQPKLLIEQETNYTGDTGDELKRQFQACTTSKIQVPEVQVTTTQTDASSHASRVKTLSRADKSNICLLM